MTSTNNFDSNSNGPDIEFHGFFDCYQSQSDFTENFETLVQESYRKTAIYFYNSQGELEQNLEIKVKALKKELHDFVEHYVSDYVDKTWLKSDLYNEVIEFLQEELTAYKYDIEKLAKDYEIDVSFVNDIEILVTTGYSQGDYALVIIDKTQLLKVWGNCPDMKDLQESIDHQFWDSPIHANIIINSNEYSYFDYELDEYTWQRDEFIKQVAKASGVLAGVLKALVPDELSYDH